MSNKLSATRGKSKVSTRTYQLAQQLLRTTGLFSILLIAGCSTKETTKQTMFPFERERKFGFNDAQSNMLIEPKYDWVSSFREGLCAVKSAGKIGFIDHKGTVVIPIIYDKALNFSGGLAGVCLEETCGYVDPQGNREIPFLFNQVEYFREDQSNLAIVRNGRKWGAINRNGEIAIEVRYSKLPLITEGHAIVTENDKYGLVDVSGGNIIPLKYDAIAYNVWNGRLFNENLLSVQMGGQWGFINKWGEVQIPFRYEKRSFFRKGYAIVQRDGKVYRINKHGKETLHSEQLINL